MNGWDDLIVFVGGECWDGVRGSHRQLAEALSRHHPVLYVDNPVSALTNRADATGGRSRPGLRIIAGQPSGPLAVLVPGAPPGLSRPGVRVATAWATRRAIRRALAALGSPHVRALVVASLDDLLHSCAADHRILYATDDYVAGASLMHLDAAHLERCERRQARRADHVVVVSEALADRWRGLGHDAVLVPNGCDPALYAGIDAIAPSPMVGLPAPIAGVVGRLSERIDLRLLEAVADRGVSLLLVGPRDPGFAPARLDALIARPNVEWAGGVPFGDLPPLVAAIHTGLTPYADTAFNRASFPLKSLEYLAAGRAVVGTDLPAHRWLRSGLITVAPGPAAFADAVEASLATPAPPEIVARRRRFAADHSWDARARDVLALLGGAAARPDHPDNPDHPARPDHPVPSVPRRA